MSSPSFPHAQQAQIIRANQRDLYHVSSLREQAESVLRSWLGTRWLSRWDKEVELAVKLAYYGFTTGRATQTLGEEYTDIWQYSASRQAVPPLLQTRAGLILLPTLSAYILGKWGNASSVGTRYPLLGMLLKRLPITLEVISEINLAIFYLSGTYYDIVKRLLGIRHLSSIPQDPHTRPPSYSLLGILLIVRLMHRLITTVQSHRMANNALPSLKGKEKEGTEAISEETFLDDRPVSLFMGPEDSEGEHAKPAEEDEHTMLDVTSISNSLRQSRNCTLCLEERTDSCSTECGHLFCWSCIVGWGREKAECPLCRQALNLARLLPIYNL